MSTVTDGEPDKMCIIHNFVAVIHVTPLCRTKGGKEDIVHTSVLSLNSNNRANIMLSALEDVHQ